MSYADLCVCVHVSECGYVISVLRIAFRNAYAPCMHMGANELRSVSPADSVVLKYYLFGLCGCNAGTPGQVRAVIKSASAIPR